MFPRPRTTAILPRPRRARRLVRWLTAAHVLAAAGLWLLVWEVSESHWLGSVVTFLPRLPWLLPGSLLVLASLLLRSHAFWINLTTTLVLLVTVAEFNVPWERVMATEASAADDNQTLRIVSCNVQNFSPDFSLVLREVQRAQPDVVAFQEAFRLPRLLHEHFDGWYEIHWRGFWVGSRWPLRLLGQCQTDVFSHQSAIAVEVEAPFGRFVLTDLHLMTARRSLVELHPRELLSGDAQLALAAATEQRAEEARQTRAFVTEHSAALPTIVLGDFNMPTSSHIYREAFGDLTNAFESCAWGFGFTAPCKPFRHWPRNTPWQRIDHILTDRAWSVRDCHVGQWDGSDHRLIAATLQWQNRPQRDFGGDSGDLRRGASR